MGRLLSVLGVNILCPALQYLYEIPLEWVYAAHSNHARGPCPHTERRQKDLRAVECYGGVGTSRPVCAFTRHIGLAP